MGDAVYVIYYTIGDVLTHPFLCFLDRQKERGAAAPRSFYRVLYQMTTEVQVICTIDSQIAELKL